MLAAGGYYHLAPDQLARYRERRRRAPRRDLRARLDTARAAGLTVDGATLKTRPRGTDPDHPRLDLLRHKGLYVARHWPPDDVLHGPRARDRVRRVWRATRPVTEWLDDHVGPSELRGADPAPRPWGPARPRHRCRTVGGRGRPASEPRRRLAARSPAGHQHGQPQPERRPGDVDERVEDVPAAPDRQ